jgi:hypothetical protein
MLQLFIVVLFSCFGFSGFGGEHCADVGRYALAAVNVNSGSHRQAGVPQRLARGVQVSGLVDDAPQFLFTPIQIQMPTRCGAEHYGSV